MKKFRLRDYLPVLIMVLCAAIFGVLLATGVMDLDTVPQLVADRPVLAVLVVLGLYVLKGFSGVVVYNALVVVAGHCAGDGVSGHRRKFAGFQFTGVLDLSGNQHGTGGVQRGVHPAKAPGRQGQR